MAKQCTAKKRVKDAKWFREKMLLDQAQEAEVVLHEDHQDFLGDRLEEMDDCDDLQLHTTSKFKEDHVDAYNSDYNDEATACAIFMASLSPTGSINGDTVSPTYDSDILSEIQCVKSCAIYRQGVKLLGSQMLSNSSILAVDQKPSLNHHLWPLDCVPALFLQWDTSGSPACQGVMSEVCHIDLLEE
ncbi:hypothetical protein Tco_0677987 [Tanacetum coccineum]|uniref:Uncharacterized protein n=1 Tax=Tanacetum coccineum TaxID=301880 RepID=A0ABQ4XEP9_9ASTR